MIIVYYMSFSILFSFEARFAVDLLALLHGDFLQLGDGCEGLALAAAESAPLEALRAAITYNL